MPTKKNSLSWMDALAHGPGPKSLKEGLTLGLKGLCMGTADIIPGVSGGTIALITGIYEDVLGAIKSVNAKVVSHIIKGEIKQAVSLVHIRFLICLLSGIGIAIISLAHLMGFLLKTYSVPTWALFLGLISASILVIGKRIKHWTGYGGVAFLFGTVAGFLITGLIPVATPEALWFVFLSGMIAICAMILPGLSGAFLLLILGKYEYITGALKDPFDPLNLTVIAVFICGCVVGITGFSRLLSWLLDKYHNATIALLTGLMCGSMRKVWPWKEPLSIQIIRGKEHVLSEKNILPDSFDGVFWVAVLLAVVGFLLVIFLERQTKGHEHRP